jgi:hypothetical protein
MLSCYVDEFIECNSYYSGRRGTSISDINMNISANQEVNLLPDSLYIATNQIMAPTGLIHWSMYITDNAAKATKYEWADLPPSTGTGKAEGLVITHIDPVTTYS